YNAGGFTVADARYAALRWSEAWNRRSLDHLARKWNLDPGCIFFTAHEPFLEAQHRRIVLPLMRNGLDGGEEEFAQTIIQLHNQLVRDGYTVDDLRQVRRAYDLAATLFGGMLRASGKTFLAHCVGTASTLARFGAPGVVVVAGLLHAAYTHGRFPS